MKTTSDRIATFLGRIAALGIVYLLVGFMASWTIDIFHPHDYPIGGFVLAVGTLHMLSNLILHNDNRPSELSASDNR